MTGTPDHITITVDEEALRKQVASIIQDEKREASMALRRAADALDPDWWREHERFQEIHYRGKFEADSRKAIADEVRRHCTLPTPLPVGTDATVYAVADWIENPPAWVTDQTTRTQPEES